MLAHQFHFHICIRPAITFPMKAFFLLILPASLGLAFAGCENDLPPDPNAQNQIERGLSGHGTITAPAKSDDSLSPDNSNAGN
jgi:hypothetical protein